MEEILTKYWPLAGGLYLFGYLLYEIWRERVSRLWPTTTARQITLQPASRFERSGNRWRWRNSRETDPALSYTVNDTEYVTPIEEFMSYSVGGVITGSKTGLPASFQLRYRKDNPNKIYYRHVHTTFFKVTALAVGFTLSAGLIGYFVYSRIMHSY